jgi:hypothetical protein
MRAISCRPAAVLRNSTSLTVISNFAPRVVGRLRGGAPERQADRAERSHPLDELATPG